ncbi:hypothetical protein REMIM1_PE00494 (plasmid) [Rhizobium etli bv. mimosae str. Mim1]|nr:hypothetical protein REMIM1_PE00494 [Rhizobium etli bv. mimosae str. Mim1]
MKAILSIALHRTECGGGSVETAEQAVSWRQTDVARAGFLFQQSRADGLSSPDGCVLRPTVLARAEVRRQ